MPSEIDLLDRVEALADREWRLLLVETAGGVVGMLALKLSEGVLDQLFVCPSQFGTGLGLALFERAKREMPLGFTLHTAATNGRARKFYEREGMVSNGEGVHPRTGHPVVYYRWTPTL